MENIKFDLSSRENIILVFEKLVEEQYDILWNLGETNINDKINSFKHDSEKIELLVKSLRRKLLETVKVLGENTENKPIQDLHKCLRLSLLIFKNILTQELT